MDFTKEEAIRIVVQCAKTYFYQLNNRDFMFILGRPESPSLLRTTFGPRNYMHLTGIEAAEGHKFSPVDFFRACMTNRLSPDDIKLASDGTTEMKLRILPELMNLPWMARMVGDFSRHGVKLYTEKLVGNVYACMGFVISGERYVPNTALNCDVRDVSKNRQRILAVFGKPTNGNIYTELCYLAKGINLADINITDTFVFNIDREHYERT